MYCIFSFKSRQEAMRLLENARRLGIDVSIVSTPKFVYVGCGLSVKTSIENYHALYNVFVSNKFSTFIGAYRVKTDGKGTRSERIL